MSTSSRTRLFKSNRRFVLAEVALVIVIFILFSWSTYILYKLFSSDSDSFFGFDSKSSSPAKLEALQQNTTLVGQPSKLLTDYHTNKLFEQPPTEHANIQGQLANYKEQILKELLARQQRLFGEDATGSLANYLRNGRPRLRSNHQDEERRPDVAELQQWRGGYKMPKSLDYLFESNNRQAPSDFPRQAHSNARAKTDHARRNSLVYLDDAPSLMQLSPTSGSHEDLAATTTNAPDAWGSLPAESQDSGLINDEQPYQQDEIPAPSTTTTTSTEAPTTEASDYETTTTEPVPSETEDADAQQVTTTQSPVLEDEASNSASADGPQDEEQDESGDKNEANQSNDPTEDERVKNTVKTIDEEVDRMTQPSSGSVSQQDLPSNLHKNVVHFDDGILLDDRSAEEAPARNQSLTRRNSDLDGSRRRSDDRAPFESSAADLIVADDLVKPPALSSVKSTPAYTRAKQRTHPVAHALVRSLKTGRGTKNMRRKKRASEGFFLSENELGSRGPDLLMRRAGDNKGLEPESPEQSDKASNSTRADSKEQPNKVSISEVAHPTFSQSQVLANDPSFEELLAHKQLLDALQQNQLSAPIAANAKSHSLPAGSISPENGSSSGIKDDDHLSADTHYSVDHGLLMYPNEKHHHGVRSHKSSKASKKKSKKKMTVAMKKGGHKSKKHKKEEKKYHKEKKFKGAKKGKKMKKGKGGKGGKKGKKLFKDKGYKKKGFKKTYVKNEFGSKKSYFDEFRDKDFKKKWKNFDDKYHYAQMKKWQAKDVKKAKKMKDQASKFKKYDKGKWKKKKFAEESSGSKKSKAKHGKDF